MHLESLINLFFSPLALEEELKRMALPITLQSGFIRELRVHIPWTALTSESVEVRIHDTSVRRLRFLCCLRTISRAAFCYQLVNAGVDQLDRDRCLCRGARAWKRGPYTTNRSAQEERW
jgi:hypothetical protein